MRVASSRLDILDGMEEMIDYTRQRFSWVHSLPQWSRKTESAAIGAAALGGLWSFFRRRSPKRNEAPKRRGMGIVSKVLVGLLVPVLRDVVVKKLGSR